MSVSSTGSNRSVSYAGVDMSLELALDDVFVKLQKHLNAAHCSVRSMAMLEDQSMDDENDDFKTLARYDNVIQDDVSEMIELFKSLKNISKQVLGKPPNPEMKAWYTHDQLMRKEEARLEKLRLSDEKLSKISE